MDGGNTMERCINLLSLFVSIPRQSEGTPLHLPPEKSACYDKWEQLSRRNSQMGLTLNSKITCGYIYACYTFPRMTWTTGQSSFTCLNVTGTCTEHLCIIICGKISFSVRGSLTVCVERHVHSQMQTPKFSLAAGLLKILLLLALVRGRLIATVAVSYFVINLA